jgi:hypothetical protein
VEPVDDEDVQPVEDEPEPVRRDTGDAARPHDSQR